MYIDVAAGQAPAVIGATSPAANNLVFGLRYGSEGIPGLGLNPLSYPRNQIIQVTFLSKQLPAMSLLIGPERKTPHSCQRYV